MSTARDGFDAIAIVVDWTDAAKNRCLDDLLDLYAANATLSCCDDGHFKGRTEMEEYWRPRLQRAVKGAFEIIALMPGEDGVWVDYVGYHGQRVRTIFRFNEDGKIRMTTCDEIRAVA
jgi:hypothetical protein